MCTNHFILIKYCSCSIHWITFTFNMVLVVKCSCILSNIIRLDPIRRIRIILTICKLGPTTIRAHICKYCDDIMTWPRSVIFHLFHISLKINFLTFQGQITKFIIRHLLLLESRRRIIITGIIILHIHLTPKHLVFPLRFRTQHWCLNGNILFLASLKQSPSLLLLLLLLLLLTLILHNGSRRPTSRSHNHGLVEFVTGMNRRRSHVGNGSTATQRGQIPLGKMFILLVEFACGLISAKGSTETYTAKL
mmetsp:Transcript_15098/g.28409  ORF Transcript_15098/g.28409 Transcript_15098/m.28409 type:complete len:249 (-) Transcript_15098:412-1158(-)